MSKYTSNDLANLEWPDRGPAPCAPDFVSDAVNVAQGAIGPASGIGFVAMVAISAVLAAVIALADSARSNAPPPAALNDAPPIDAASAREAPSKGTRRADDRRAFETHGPRFDGSVRLMMFREEWGLSANAGPSGVRVAFAGHEAALR